MDALIKLREANLFQKDDVYGEDLVLWSTKASSRMRFAYLKEWDPSAVRSIMSNARCKFENKSVEVFKMVLNAELKYYPEEIGFLFHRDPDDPREKITIADFAFEKYCADSVMKAIANCRPFCQGKLPILHHVAIRAPHLLNTFGKQFPSDVYLRDEKGRSLLQAKLASGN